MGLLTTPCLDCGHTGIRHQGRGLCRRCYDARRHAGTLAARPPTTDFSRARGATDHWEDATCAECGRPCRVRRWRVAAGRVYCGHRCAGRAAARRRGGADYLAVEPGRTDHLARADAALRAEIRARLAAGRSLVLPDAPAYRATGLPAAPAAAD